MPLFPPFMPGFYPLWKTGPTQPPEKNGSIMENKLMSISINFNPSKVWYRPWKVTFKKSYLQNRKVVFQPSFFRGELLNFVRVPLKASHSCLWNHATNSYVFPGSQVSPNPKSFEFLVRETRTQHCFLKRKYVLRRKKQLLQESWEW